MKLGTEDKKKVKWLGGLLAVLAAVYGFNVFSSSAPSSTPRPKAPSAKVAAPALAPLGTDTPARGSSAKASNRNRSDEFIPVLHSKRAEDQIDPIGVDPTLRWDRLAKLQEVGSAGSGRNLFIMGQPPAAPAGPEPIVRVVGHVMGPTPEIVPPPPPGPPPPPPLPPITFKYYGFSTVRKDGKKTAFFLMGDEVSVRAVGEMIDRVYRLQSIGLTSAVVEDTQSKRTQTVPLAEEAQS